MIFIRFVLDSYPNRTSLIFHSYLIRETAGRWIERMIRRSSHHHQIERLERLGLWSHKRNLSALRFTHRAIDAFIGIGGYSHQSITVTMVRAILSLDALNTLPSASMALKSTVTFLPAFGISNLMALKP